MSKKKIVVLGIGNLLLKDEGIGIHVIEALRKQPLPKNVELIDGSVLGFDLLPIITRCDNLIVIDAVKTKDEPASVYKFNAEDIKVESSIPVSLHDIDFFQVLALAKRLKKMPKTKIIAVVPKDLGWGLELSLELKKKIPQITRLIKGEINEI